MRGGLPSRPTTIKCRSDLGFVEMPASPILIRVPPSRPGGPVRVVLRAKRARSGPGSGGPPSSASPSSGETPCQQAARRRAKKKLRAQRQQLEEQLRDEDQMARAWAEEARASQQQEQEQEQEQQQPDEQGQEKDLEVADGEGAGRVKRLDSRLQGLRGCMTPPEEARPGSGLLRPVKPGPQQQPEGRAWVAFSAEGLYSPNVSGCVGWGATWLGRTLL